MQGLLMVHTGDGKGKTTAALGLALRAFGAGLRVLILQFIKGGQTYGELNAIKLLEMERWKGEKVESDFSGKIKIQQCGIGFTSKGDFDEHKKFAQETLKLAEKEILSGEWDLIILDEINYAVKFGLISEDELFTLIKKRPAEVHLLLTGRDAPKKIIEVADLVTEMTLIKHPFQQGVKAQRGIEF